MKKFICSVCGYVYEGEAAPEKCPQCKAPREKFVEQAEGEGLAWADEHRIGVAKDVDPRVIEDLRANFNGECSEVGMYLAMSREKAEHAAKFAELLGEVVWPDTKKNLQARVDAEHGATQGKKDLATLAKQLGYDAIHDTVHEMCKDEARHGCAFQGLLKRYFS